MFGAQGKQGKGQESNPYAADTYYGAGGASSRNATSVAARAAAFGSAAAAPPIAPAAPAASKAAAPAPRRKSSIGSGVAAVYSAQLHERLRLFYAKHNPDNVDKIGKLVAKYGTPAADDPSNEEGMRSLDKQLKHKYGISLTDFEASQSL